jgi:periplasmic divalent cation tolerance protein
MSALDGKVVVLVTAPAEEEAARIARALVEEGLCACASVVGPVRSIYKWEGQVCDDVESLIVMKTRRALFARLEARVRQLHSYDVPEVIGLDVAAGSEPYLRWIDEVTAGG